MAVSGIEYDQLSKVQRLAMLLIVVGPDAAGQILKNFEDVEIEMVCKHRKTLTPRTTDGMHPEKKNCCALKMAMNCGATALTRC